MFCVLLALGGLLDSALSGRLPEEGGGEGRSWMYANGRSTLGNVS